MHYVREAPVLIVDYFNPCSQTSGCRQIHLYSLAQRYIYAHVYMCMYNNYMYVHTYITLTITQWLYMKLELLKCYACWLWSHELDSLYID